MSGKKNVEVIRAVESRPIGNKGETRDIIGFLNALNPLGHISETISRILEYKLEAKRLEVEAKRIEEEANIRHHQIDAALEVAITRLNERREAIRGFLMIASQEIENCHIERMAIVRTIDNLNSLLIKDDISVDERKMAIESLPTLTRLLSEYGERGSMPFRQLVETTQKAIESVPSARQLLTFEGGE